MTENLEPVAWMYECANVRQVFPSRSDSHSAWTETPLYTRPTPAAPDDVIDPRWIAVMNAQIAIERLERRLERSNNALRTLSDACYRADAKEDLSLDVDGAMLDEATASLNWQGPECLAGPEIDARAAYAAAEEAWTRHVVDRLYYEASCEEPECCTRALYAAADAIERREHLKEPSHD